MKTTIAQTMIAGLALLVVPPAAAKPHRPAAAHAAAKKTAEATPKTATAMQAIAPQAPEGPDAKPAAADTPAADADAAMPGAHPGGGPGATRGTIPPAATVGPMSAAQAACAASQGQNVAIPDGFGSQTTRCGVNASLGRVDARVDFRVRPNAPH